MNANIINRVTHSVTRIEAYKNGELLSIGTGFFYASHDNGNTHIPLVITNKHVIEDSDYTIFRLSEVDEFRNPIPNRFEEIILNTQNDWKSHPDENIDLCAASFVPIVKQIQKSGKNVLWNSISKSFIPSAETMKNVTSAEDVIMVGYPNGILDEYNNRPIFRKGITATHPRIKYNDKDEFLIDIAVFGGSSGSPVFMWKEGFNVINSEGTKLVEKNGFFNFIGILYAGPTYNAEGRLIINPVPAKMKTKVISEITMNLGLAISSELVQDFDTVSF